MKQRRRADRAAVEITEGVISVTSAGKLSSSDCVEAMASASEPASGPAGAAEHRVGADDRGRLQAE